MPRNGSGVYSLPAGNPVVTGTTISSSGWANPTLSDLAAAITASIAVDGQTVPTANLPMGNFRHLNVANGQNTNEYATVGQIQTAGFQLLGGTAGTINITKSITTTSTVSAASASVTTLTATGNVTANDLTLTGGGFISKGRSYFNITTNNGEIALQNTAGSYFYLRGRNTGGLSGGMEWVNNAYSLVVASMDDGGNLTANNVTITSDRRLKSRIKRIRNATEVVLAWVGVTFQRKGDKTKRRHAGFIAGDMAESAPELVFDDANGFKSVAYGNASAYLAAAFQELEARVRKLESKK
ncbi:tail fiber domain-containing protein [Burkholderia sp. B21-005]|uniref:tail fiber domain-containing protein n=1 Tax=Burkholderia sp. B21-005 TaxID=2890406 RepID=UPI001E56DD40|nr:tail fiber domain-containing protein [Burkholderia sp. B21-005]UEP43135.1 tail fiber domain-containing protein [Burkholderia sp. B21-005]